jgi:hypothetical protein
MFVWKFWFTMETALPSLAAILTTDDVSHDPTRKSFLAKLIGLVAIAGLAPRALAKAAATETASSPTPRVLPFTVRPDARAVARRENVV